MHDIPLKGMQKSGGRPIKSVAALASIKVAAQAQHLCQPQAVCNRCKLRCTPFKGITHYTFKLKVVCQQDARAPIGWPSAKGRLPFEIPVRIIRLLFTRKTAQIILQNTACFMRRFDFNLRTKSIAQCHAFGVLELLSFNAFRTQIVQKRK